MSNLLKYTANRIKDSSFIIPIFVFVVAACLISLAILWEDYSTSLFGYQALPTRKANDWVIPMVAAMPQVFQVILFYAFLRDTNTNKWALALAFGLFLVDSGTDVYYKSNGFQSNLILLSVLETFTVYTLGSEVLFTMSFGLFFELLEPFLSQVDKTISGLGRVLGSKGRQSYMPPPKSGYKPSGKPPMPSGSPPMADLRKMQDRQRGGRRWIGIISFVLRMVMKRAWLLALAMILLEQSR
jgi:hypothetical protein